MATAVIARLSGYDSIIVVKFGLALNAVNIQSSLTPQTQIRLSRAGPNDRPKPLR